MYLQSEHYSKLDVCVAGMVVARVRLNTLDAQAYAACFHAVFSCVKKNHPLFEVGKTLYGIILDWSDHQLKGLEQAVGKDVAGRVVKGCQVRCDNHSTCICIYPCGYGIRYQGCSC